MTGPLQAATRFAAAVEKVNGMLENINEGLKQNPSTLHEMRLCTNWCMAEQELVMLWAESRETCRVKCCAFAGILFRSGGGLAWSRDHCQHWVDQITLVWV